jgi:hypothetical protein
MTSEFNGWGYKCAWFAVRSTDPSAVAECLQLSDVSSEPIGDVTDKTYERDSGYVAVIGPIDGWCLAPFDLMLSDDLRMLDLVGALSVQFGEAQVFASYRVVAAFQFERWINGQPIRQVYVADGEVFRNHGEPDGFETSLLDINEDVQDDEVDDDNFGFAMSIDEDTVLAIAEAWSVDPLSLPERDDLPALVLVGLSPFRDKTGLKLIQRPVPQVKNEPPAPSFFTSLRNLFLRRKTGD